MKALVLDKQAAIHSKPLQVKDVPEPVPSDHEIRIKIEACGVCRTDLHVIEGDLKSKKLPIIPGHQVVGIVDRLGSKCHRAKIGQRVGVAWLGYTCQSCEFCKSGKENLCESSLYTGYHLNGGYAEYAVANEDYVYLLPENAKASAIAPLLCSGIIGYRALKRSNLPPGGKLALYGFGGSAHVTIQIALACGAEVFVATRGAEHRALAKELGASWVGDAHDTPPVPSDSAIVFAPAGEIVPLALRALKKGGTVALAGIHMSDVPQMKYEECLFHEKNLVSVEANTRADGEEFLKLALSIPVRTKVTEYSISEVNDALIQLKEDRIKGSAVMITK